MSPLRLFSFLLPTFIIIIVLFLFLFIILSFSHPRSTLRIPFLNTDQTPLMFQRLRQLCTGPHAFEVLCIKHLKTLTPRITPDRLTTSCSHSLHIQNHQAKLQTVRARCPHTQVWESEEAAFVVVFVLSYKWGGDKCSHQSPLL